MLELIKEIIERFGGRSAGSSQEREAQLFFKEKLKEFCSDVRVHEFSSALTGWMGSLKFFCAILYFNLILFWISIPVATLLSVANAVFFIGHFAAYRDWLDFLFPKLKSLNITGVLEPQEEAKSTIIVSGHIDSVFEFKWWYKLKQFGATLSVLSGFLFVLLALFFLILFAAGYNASALPTWSKIVWFGFLAISPILVTLFNIHGKNVVDGAIDNLSGVAVAFGVGKEFADSASFGKSTLLNTRLKLVSFGCEEAGLRGAKAYVEDHLEEMRNEKAILLNVDGIKEKKELRILTGETWTLVKYPQDLIEKVEESFIACNVPVIKTGLHVGATDSSAFAWKNIPAVGLIGMTSDVLDPCYHTRLDVVENLNPDGIESLKEVLVHFINQWDKK